MFTKNVASANAKSFKPINVSAFQRQRQVLSKFNSKPKLNSQSKSESKLQSQKSTLLGEKQTLLDNSPFKKYKNISQYNILSKEKKEKIQKAHQYYLNQIMIHKCLTSASGSLCWMCSKPCHKPYNKTCSWIQKEVPVEGWKAEPSIIINSPTEIIHTYNILDCPQFNFDSSRSYELGDLLPILSYFNQVCTRTVIRKPYKQLDKYNELFPFAPLTLYEDIYGEETEEGEEKTEDITQYNI